MHLEEFEVWKLIMPFLIYTFWLSQDLSKIFALKFVSFYNINISQILKEIHRLINKKYSILKVHWHFIEIDITLLTSKFAPWPFRFIKANLSDCTIYFR